MIWTNDPTRIMLVASLGVSYALVCLAPYVRTRRKRLAAQQARAEAAASPGWIIAYASQTGNAEELAGQTLATLRLAGIPAQLSELSDLSAEELQRAERVLFLVSTYGEGDAPDAAATFAGRLMTTGLALPQLHYALLALGDSAYAQFCGFGRALDGWLQAQGAQSLFARIEVDRSSADAINAWRQQLSHLAGTSDAPDWSAPAFDSWRLADRVLLNPGSAGAPVYHLELEPVVQGDLPAWQSGDLAQIAAPADAAHARDYSIASVPADGRVHLLVRLLRHDDGSHGLASGWLTQQAEVGQAIQLRLRAHRRFRLEDNAQRPLILIGNGSGIAGLRGHLKARALAGQHRNWLLFGERNAACDYHYRDELDAWQRDGVLEQLDMVFSRDQPQRRYVQDCLKEQAEALRAWVAAGAAIYVCGSLEGMAAGVDDALAAVVGRAALDDLAAAGRYRRDVY